MVEIVGHKLVTHHPVIKPVSSIEAGNGIVRCRDGRAIIAFSPSRDPSGDARGTLKAPFWRKNAKTLTGV
jgi:hypothetical protein